MDNTNKTEKTERIFSVSEYIEAVNIALKRFNVKVAGEITQVTLSGKGHIYFSIKDKQNSVLNCVIWKYNYQLSGIKLEEGISVVLSGYSNIYAPLGNFKFIADSIALKGQGALKKAYNELKKKLAGEGIFDTEKKRLLPEFPKNIGVITSKHGAVINDLLNNLGRYGFRVEMVDSRVEGQEAVKDILKAMEIFKKTKIEILVIMRGGGSLESLQAFNNEILTRETRNFPVPVIAAIGHDKDVPLVQMAADVACSTPTAVATILNKSWADAPLKIHYYERAIIDKFNGYIFYSSQEFLRLFNEISVSLTNIFDNFKDLTAKINEYIFKVENLFAENKKFIENKWSAIINLFASRMQGLWSYLRLTQEASQARDPERALSLGYCIIRKRGSIIKSVRSVRKGDEVDLQLRDGAIKSKINNIIKKYDKPNK